MTVLLRVPGLSCDAQSLYERLLRVPSISLAADHGLDDSAIDELTNAGLALRLPDAGPAHYEDSDSRLVATTPDEALARLLCAKEKRLNERQERLLDVRNELGRLRGSFEAGRGSSRPDGLAEVVTGRASVKAAHEAVQRAARTQLSAFDTAYVDAPAGSIAIPQPVLTRLAPGLVLRTIYDHSVFDIGGEAGVAAMTDAARRGEVQRMVPELPLKLLLADESMALIALTLTGMDGALLVRAQPLLALLRTYFDLTWARAIPLGTERPSTQGAEQYGPIPRLLASGLSDEAIANQLGLSLRTVRRRIAAMMDDLGALTRFQAGVLAQRSGLLTMSSDVDAMAAESRPAPDVIDMREPECSNISV